MAKKRKPNAEHRALTADWQALQQRYQQMPKFAREGSPTGRAVQPFVPELQRLPSKFTPHGGTAKAVPKYTGNNVLGITVMHKSCLQPVFSQQAAIDAANMRRN